MGEKLVVGPINKGLRTDREPFVIDNDSFPTLVNAYQWRGRVKRKRGTSFLGRLNRFLGTTNGSGNITVTINISSSSPPNPQSIQSEISQFVIGSDIFIDQGGGSPVSLVTNGAGAGTLNRTTTVLTITGSQPNTAVYYYPDLPVMGLEELVLNAAQFPQTLAFDTVYSYQISTASPYTIYDVSFYKNLPSSTYPSYVSKTTWTPVTWSGPDYQQFWTINFAGSLWATNGKPGMQVQKPSSATRNSATQVTFAVSNSPAVIGDFIFVNEWTASSQFNANTLNFQTGYVTAVGAGTITVTFPNANIASDTYTSGIIQYLTTRSDTNSSDNIDGIRWYDGDPTNGGNYPPTSSLGWVNYAPPLSQGLFSIDSSIAAQYYLVGATMIYPFRDFLIFVGPYIQTSAGQIAGNQPIWLQDTIIFAQNGTPYYTASFDNTSTPQFGPQINYHPILVPQNQTAVPQACWEDISGFGGYISSGVAQPILTLVPNEDVLILGYPKAFTRLIYTGNNLIPFLFYRINTELGSGSTFSAVTFDQGSFSLGNFGIVQCSQVSAVRTDLQIPDQAFQINYLNNGQDRVCSARDYINEWVYLTYPSNEVSWKFPNQTLLYNYRDDSWAILNESYTTYGTFRRATGDTWSTNRTRYLTWTSWTVPWNAGQSTLLMPEVIAGNQQGYVLFRDTSTGESVSGYIQALYGPQTITNVSQATNAVVTSINGFVPGTVVTITQVAGMTQLNGNTYTVISATPTQFTLNVNSTLFSPYVSGGIATPTSNMISMNHCLNEGDYVLISGSNGTISSQVNGKIFSVIPLPGTTDQIALNPPLNSGTYTGGAQFTRMYVPYIQTKQFPVAWQFSRKTRIGPQMYLFTRTSNGQITVLIFLSQDGTTPYNIPSENNAIVYSTVLYTCPESVNLGLSAANTNLQQINQIGQSGLINSQSQIWHRMNTSLIGDTVQVGFTLSDAQMRDTTFSNQFAEIEFHGMIMDVSPSQILS